MRQEKSRRNREVSHRKRLLLLFFSLSLIVLGLWFTTTSVYKVGKGYISYKMNAPEREMELKKEVSAAGKVEEEEEKEVLYPDKPEVGEEIGELYIPKIKSVLPIIHGTDEDELEKGVGHYAGSVMPGEKDNSVLSGHRDTVFRRLGEVGEGDILEVTTKAGTFEYRVNKVRIVDADDRTVIVPKPRAMLTVTTCYPFDFIGDAPQRYILVAHLISKK
ncbi:MULTISPECIES: class D sortase [Cytobacillus]|uniref:class D sortase n=1 Tax=Cytobacillus TaxID=2675230 RepID=UPI00203B328A|nr:MULTISPECIES: class D sortase [Cytobacillus]MBY0158856.1 class D sortase [Cytobacillus firmus]MCM3391512.1 class D sortase [Cytobacillus oceanisediminis]MCM3529074.1 class D sortase [Cytobacillus oceanisediminis]UQX53777.1 class D sortase [Cytobacillus pseudoceanisediminis]USK43981.1 class D sortase [Cytobacillus oceanisediminis]